MSCYIVQEVDGVSRFTLEDGSGSLLLEFCPPVGGENPIGGPAEAALPVRRGRRRRLEQIIDDDDFILMWLTSDD